MSCCGISWAEITQPLAFLQRKCRNRLMREEEYKNKSKHITYQQFTCIMNLTLINELIKKKTKLL